MSKLRLQFLHVGLAMARALGKAVDSSTIPLFPFGSQGTTVISSPWWPSATTVTIPELLASGPAGETGPAFPWKRTFCRHRGFRSPPGQKRPLASKSAISLCIAPTGEKTSS